MSMQAQALKMGFTAPQSGRGIQGGLAFILVTGILGVPVVRNVAIRVMAIVSSPFTFYGRIVGRIFFSGFVLFAPKFLLDVVNYRHVQDDGQIHMRVVDSSGREQFGVNTGVGEFGFPVTRFRQEIYMELRDALPFSMYPDTPLNRIIVERKCRGLMHLKPDMRISAIHDSAGYVVNMYFMVSAKDQMLRDMQASLVVKEARRTYDATLRNDGGVWAWLRGTLFTEFPRILSQ